MIVSVDPPSKGSVVRSVWIAHAVGLNGSACSRLRMRSRAASSAERLCAAAWRQWRRCGVTRYERLRAHLGGTGFERRSALGRHKRGGTEAAALSAAGSQLLTNLKPERLPPAAQLLQSKDCAARQGPARIACKSLSQPPKSPRPSRACDPRRGAPA